MKEAARAGEAAAQPKVLRLFYAIWPNAAAREPLAAIATDVASAAGGRAIAVRNLHITIAFIGSVPSERVDALLVAGAEAAQDASAFGLMLDRLGGAHDGELVWLAPAQLPPNLVTLHANLDAALQRQRFAVERRAFRPHVTLARRCVRRVRHPPIEPIPWRVTRLTLMASTAGRTGSEYRELAAWALR